MMRKPIARLVSLAILLIPGTISAQLAKTPPMGWNSWNFFRDTIDDAIVRQVAQSLVSSGLAAKGYVYLNIDDSWAATVRDAAGNIQSDPSRFPDMAGLAAYVHSLGLKIGIYSSPGPATCAGRMGSYQHEAQDAQTFAAWGIDYLKYDWCSATHVYKPSEQPAAYKLMGDALAATGRPIVYSICQYGANGVWTWAASSGGNLWRTTHDIKDNWTVMSTIGFDQQLGLAPFAGPGHWNDPDMLEVGNGGMTFDESKTHFSLWAMLAAPLVAGNDIRNMNSHTLEILSDSEVIAVDQDKLGNEGTRAAVNGLLEVWQKPLANGALAVGLFNRGATPATVTATWQDLGLAGSHAVRDLWAHVNLGDFSNEYSASVPEHGVVLVKIAH